MTLPSSVVIIMVLPTPVAKYTFSAISRISIGRLIKSTALPWVPSSSSPKSRRLVATSPIISIVLSSACFFRPLPAFSSMNNHRPAAAIIASTSNDFLPTAPPCLRIPDSSVFIRFPYALWSLKRAQKRQKLATTRRAVQRAPGNLHRLPCGNRHNRGLPQYTRQLHRIRNAHCLR